MPSREFPAPPDLSELLKFFESKEGKARVDRQHNALGVKTQRIQPLQAPKRVSSAGTSTTNTKAWIGATKPTTTTSNHGRSKPAPTTTTRPRIIQEEITPSMQWNASTQLPTAPSKILRHQLLSRTYQPPASVYVVPSEASHLLDRLAKGTISSRSKLHSQGDRVERGIGEEKSSREENSADTRGRDAIQTLLFYRKEVEKRRRLDPSNLRPGE